MRCPNCQRLILNNTPNCPYCGQAVGAAPASPASPLGGPAKPSTNSSNPMFATNPMPQPAGVPPVEHHEAVAQEVKKRHWQRWVFYGLIIILFVGAIGLIVKIYNDNTNLLLAVSQTKEELTKASADLAQKDEQIATIDENLRQAQEELNRQAEQYKNEVEGQATAVKDLEQCRLELTASDANVYNLILELGTGITSSDLSRIPVADANLNTGPDADQDGLSDEVEAAFGTKADAADTDGDSFNDKQEILGGFDPLQAGVSLGLDPAYAEAQKGRIVIQVEGNKDAWYVSPEDGKRYFLGRPGNGYKAMRSIEFWTKEYSAQ